MTGKENLKAFADGVGQDVNKLTRILAVAMENQGRLIRLLEKQQGVFDIYHEVHGGDKADFLEWLRSGKANVEQAVRWWIKAALLDSETPEINGTDKGLPVRPLKLSDWENANGDMSRMRLSDNAFTLSIAPQYQQDRYFTQGAIEFTTTRNGLWLILGKNAEGELLSIAFINGQNITTRVIKFNATFTQLYNENAAIAAQRENPFSKSLPVGTIVRVMPSETATDIFIKRPESNQFIHWLNISKEQFPNIADFDLNYTGFCVGISGAENTGTTNTDLLKNAYRILPKREKYAVLAVVGQSNAVGYDESVIKAEEYPENDRLFQVGIYDEDNLNIIPLSAHAHSWQDMRRFTHPDSHLAGTKGLHYPLAKALLKHLPEDYKLVVISSTYGGTAFSSGSVGSYNADTMKPSAGALKWGTESPYYLALKDRLSYVLDQNPQNAFLGVVYIQGEHDHSQPQAWETGYTALFNDFQTWLSENYAERVYNPKYWWWVESTHYWQALSGYQAIMQTALNLNPKTHGYVQIPTDTDTNAINGTGKTSSNRPTHFGNNAYWQIAQKILTEMENADRE